MAISYTRTEFAEKIKVDRHTLVKWERTGKLKPAGYNGIAAFYTDDQLTELREKTKSTKVYNNSTWVDFCNIPRNFRGYNWKRATKKRSKIPYKCENKSKCLVLPRRL